MLAGLSPHTRGKQCLVSPDSLMPGPIPAYAGETPRYSNSVEIHRAYPRIRGGNDPSTIYRTMGKGLSPHTRGKRKRP